MVDVFTSIATAGWSDNAVQAAFDLRFRWDFRNRNLLNPFVDVQPDNVPQRGNSVTIQKNAFFGQTEVDAAKTPLTEEVDVDATKLPATTPVVLTPQERGFANIRTIKLKNRALTSIDPVIAMAVGIHSADVHDELVQDEMRTATNLRAGTGNAGSGTYSAGTLTSADTARASDLRYLVTKLRSASVPTWDGQYYVGHFHPNIIHDLREETGSGSWRTPHEYGEQQEIFNGEMGEFEGIRFVSNPKLYRSTDADGAASAEVFRGFVQGREALAKSVITAPHTVLGPVTDKLMRFRTLGWYSDLAYKLFRPESIWGLYAGSSVPA